MRRRSKVASPQPASRRRVSLLEKRGVWERCLVVSWMVNWRWNWRGGSKVSWGVVGKVGSGSSSVEGAGGGEAMAVGWWGGSGMVG